MRGVDMINSWERLDDLQLDGLRLIQNPDKFCFGIDAVLLSEFAKGAILKEHKVLDMCTGNGIIPVLLSGKTECDSFCGIEIQEDASDMAQRSVSLNNLQDRITIIHGDVKNAGEIFSKNSFDIITCNPPYKEAGSGLVNPDLSIAYARHEILCSLEDVVSQASVVLKDMGKFFMIHRPQRLIDIIVTMREYKIEPKRLRFVHPSPDKKPVMVLVEGVKYGKPKLTYDPPLYTEQFTL